MKRSSTTSKNPGNKVYSIVVDGETEKWYLELMKKHLQLKSITIKPDLPKKKKLVELYRLVKEYARDYTKVIWIIDFDTIVKENNERRKGSTPVFRILEDYINRLKRLGNVYVFINTPCLEFWYLLHFKDTGKFYSSCEMVCQAFKGTVLEDYEKTEKYYKQSKTNIYLKLQAFQPNAKNNAEKLGDFDFADPETAKSEIYKVFDLLENI